MVSQIAELWSRESLLFAKFLEGDGTTDWVDEAIILDREILDLCHPGHPLRSRCLSNLANCLSVRYERLGIMNDLDEAVVLAREALELNPPGYDDRYAYLQSLAYYLFDRYKQRGKMEDLDEAILLDQEALTLCPPGHPGRSACLTNYAGDLATRYTELGGPEDLHIIIALTREALEVVTLEQHLRSALLSNLALYLSYRYDQLGEMENLDEAIVLSREALLLCPHNLPERSSFLNNLALHLSTRFWELRAREDLDEAIVLDQEALELRPPGHPDRSESLVNLASKLYQQYKQLGKTEALHSAVMLSQDSLVLRPPGHPLRHVSLNKLADCLSDRYKQFGAVEDIDRAIFLDQEALAVIPFGNPWRFVAFSSLVNHLSIRYNELKHMDDLDEAIHLAQQALALLPHCHPRRSYLLETLATHLSMRFNHSAQLCDRDELFELYAELARLPHPVSSVHLSAAKAWISAAEEFHHKTRLLAYETSLRFVSLHLATLSSLLPQHLTVLKNVMSSLSVDAFSACLRDGLPTRAVECVEQGRGVFWSQLTRLRSPLDDVIASGPAGKAFAEKFTELTLTIRHVLHLPNKDQHDWVCHLNIELQRVVDAIRNLPGLSHFLLPSPFSELRQAAIGGPVIIVNASKYSRDALIILLNRDPVHIPLQITKERVRELSSRFHFLTSHATRDTMTKELAFYLRELWNEVVSPIVDVLQTVHPSRSRIWWCPTAEFSLLPLHAAGPYRKGQRNLSDLYISSYTSTLAALIRARRPIPSSRLPTEQKRFLAIGEANAANQRELPSVCTELSEIGRRVDGLATFTHIEGAESCVERVAEAFGKAQWVHLACHGLPNWKQPFESAFALYDGHFSIKRIIQCEPENPEFAYLSACHTTVGDEENPDEAIHLASAMQFAGFRSVIGTMWAVDDEVATKITSMFYDNVILEGRLDHTRAAYALHKTMRSLVNLPLDQRVLYIHLGA